MNTKIKRLLKDLCIFAAGNASSKVVLFLLMPLYTTRLTTSEYGISDTLNTFVELIVPLLTLCMADAVYRFAIGEDTTQKGIIFITGFKIIVKGFLIATLIAITLRLFTNYQYVYIVLLMFTTYSLKQYFGYYLRGIGESLKFAISGVIGTLSLVCFNILLLVHFSCGISGYLWSVVLSNAISALLMCIFIHPLRLVLYNCDKEQNNNIKREMLEYSLPMIPNSVSWWVNSASNKYIILFFLGSSASGLFSAASKLPSVINLLSSIFQQAWQYSAASEYNKSNTSTFYSKVFNLYSPFIILSCSVVIASNPLISRFVLKGDFFNASCYVPFMLFSAVLGCYSVFWGGIYTASKKSKMLMISTILGAATNVVLGLILIPRIEIYGALIASIISYLIVVVVRIICSKKYVKVYFNKWVLVGSLIALFVQAFTPFYFKGKEYYCASIAFIIFLFVINAYGIINNKRSAKT